MKRLIQETGPLLHVPAARKRMFLCVRPFLVALSTRTGARMQPRAKGPRVTETRHQVTWHYQRSPAQPHPQFLERHHRGVMHMLMRHGMVRRER